MDTFFTSETCQTCPGRIVCRCLNVSEESVIAAITTQDLQTLRDLRRHTGAGEGCTCCHEKLKEYLARHSLTVVCGS